MLHFATTDSQPTGTIIMQQRRAAVRSRTRKNLQSGVPNSERGYALFVVMSIMFLIVIAGLSSMRLSGKTEVLASSSIQRNKAFQSADAASRLASRTLEELTAQRAVADSWASDGVFQHNTVQAAWWNTAVYSGSHAAEPDAVLGVMVPPRYLYEELGSYISDGGSGVVNLDRGSANYGRLSASGREFVLYRVQSAGSGAVAGSTSVVETILAKSF